MQDVIIIQPPIVQLNTAYPSGAYLADFFRKQNLLTKWYDLNIELFYKIFSKKGIEKIFELSAKKAELLADKAQKNGDEATAFNLRRYVSQSALWINWIDTITDILRADKSGFENAHRFAFGAHVPRGNRMETFLANLDHNLTSDDTRSLASYALADLADYITAVIDENFSLVRYAEHLTISESTFRDIENGIDSPILKEFYEPLLREKFDNLKKESCLLVLVTIPFPGTFASALTTGRYFKQNFSNAEVIFGGGFVNTELRDTNEQSLVKYCDAICYDRGYASYKQLLDLKKNNTNTEPIYKLRQFKESENGTIKIIEPAETTEQSLVYEKEMTQSVIPDFSDIDFGKYPRMIDDTNPMHRLWSDGAWIKAYMAHGCYWHKCSFCDVTLDYVCGYCPTNVRKLYNSLLEQCKQKNVFGIHFVDEAMPPVLMIEFAKANLENGSPITWWGNIRFEKAFTKDVAELLAAGGLTGVSAGLESATGNGLTTIHKGTDLESIVGACCAFKEAGILVHAYMIYGYWWETPQDLINSMETLRQFYANGLLDSCFWHKFVLTRHSRVYKEWKEGLIKDLAPIEQKDSNGKPAPLFAKNGLHFKGEEKSEKYGRFLEYSLNEWMHSNSLETPVQKWFDFPVPKPTVSKNFIESFIEKYELKRDESYRKPIPEDDSRKIWLGGNKIKCGKSKITWFYMGEQYFAPENAPEGTFRGKGLVII